MVNKHIIIGNLGKDPDIKTTPSGTAVCTLNIATTDRVKRGDQWEDVTDWHKVVCFGKTAENAGKYLQKGSQVYIEGKVKTRSWEKDGVRHYQTETVADNVRYLGGKQGGGQRRDEPRREPTQQRQEPQSFDPEDGLPF